MDKKDKVFAKNIKKSFEFDEEVANVFDDMLERSIPFYKENLVFCIDLLNKYLKDGDLVYDLGCSTGTFLLNLERTSKKKLKLVGIDNSRAMISRLRKKLRIYDSKIKIKNEDILKYKYKKAKAFLANYTLQFIRPLEREKFIKKIYKNLKKDGIFIFSEKIITEDKKLNKNLIDIYYKFKQNQGYSNYEITQKREALENILLPYTRAENIIMSKSSGFRHCETIFTWGNFATFIAIK